MAEYDEAVANNNEQRLHRVAHILFQPGSPCRTSLDNWIKSPSSALSDHPSAYIEIQAYALVSIVERRVEQVHSMIKRLGASACNVAPPYICAKLRETSNMKFAAGEQRIL